ncbi:MAG TPA: GAF domain-containing protein [Chloroflexota bacterium]
MRGRELERGVPLERQAEELAALRDVGRALSGSLELGDVLQVILRAVTETLGFDMGAIALVDPKDQMIRGVLGINQDEEVIAAIHCRLDSSDIRAHVVRTGKVEVVDGWDPRLDRETFEQYGHHNHATIFGPITVYGERIGVLSASRQRATHSPISQHEYGLFSLFLDHAGIALQNARILESERKKSRRLWAVNEVGRRATASLDLHQLLIDTTQLVRDTFGYQRVAVMLIDPHEPTMLYRAAYSAGSDEDWPDLRQPIGTGMIGWVAQTGQTQLANDTRRDAHFVQAPGPHTGSELDVPLKVGPRIVGVLSIEGETVDSFEPDDIPFLETLADQIAIAIHNSRLYQAAQRQTQQLGAINTVARRMSNLMTTQELMPFVVALLRETFHWYSVSIFLRPAGDDATSIVLAAAAGGEPGPMPPGTRLRLGRDGIVGWVAASGDALLANDVLCEPRFLAYPGLPDTAAEVAVPIRRGDRIAGVLDVQSAQRDAFDALDVATLQTLADQIGIALENARLYTEAAERATHLAAANEQLAELDRMKSHFISLVSHELRTPLGLIKGYVGTLQRSDLALDVESRQEFLTVIEEEADNLADLVGNLLDASRLEAGTLALELHPTRLLPLIRKAVHDARERAPDYQFALDLPGELPLVNADTRRLEQVFRNLLDNAVKYSPSGSTITISAEAAQAGVIVTVRDEGLGIADEHRERIFDRFFRVDQTDNRRGGGSGLGLAITKGIVEGHGGRIWMESAPGVGSTFRIWLPG